jgi:Fe-S cluster assembly protein SufD
VREARHAAFGAFVASGLPHRRIEEWKYTDLRAGLKEAYPPAAGGKAALSEEALERALGPALSWLECIRILFVNGAFVSAEMAASKAPGKDYEFDPLAHALGAKGFDWMKPHLMPPAGAKPDAMRALNTAFMSDGAVLRIEAGAAIDRPIHLVFLSDASGPARATTRNLVEVGEGASVTLLESHVGAGDAPRQTSSLTEITVGKGAKVVHVKLLAEGAASTHLGRWQVGVGEEAAFDGFQMTAGAGLARSEIVLDFAGEGAKVDLSGVMLARGSGHIDTTLVVDHAAPGGASRELFKAVLEDRARAVFQGKLIVQPGAQKTDAKQMAQGLLLSEDAEFDSKPELEIYADDVACGHGSTSGQIDDGLLFYLRTRGIPEPEARALLITAFVGEALEKVAHEGVRRALEERAAEWLVQRAAHEPGKTAKRQSP